MIDTFAIFLLRFYYIDTRIIEFLSKYFWNVLRDRPETCLRVFKDMMDFPRWTRSKYDHK